MNDENTLKNFQNMLIHKYIKRELINEDKLEIASLIQKKPNLYEDFRNELIKEVEKNNTIDFMTEINKHLLEKVNLFSTLDEKMLIKVETKKSKKNNNIMFINDCLEIKEDSSKNTVNFFTMLKLNNASVHINFFIKSRGNNEDPIYNIILKDFSILDYNNTYVNLWKSEINELLVEIIDKKASDNLIKINTVLHQALKIPEVMKKLSYEKSLKKILMELKDFYDIILLSSDNVNNKEIVKTIDSLLQDLKPKVNKLDIKI